MERILVNWTYLLFTIFAVFTPLQVQAGQLAKLPLPAQLSLLGNKLVIRMPAGSHIEARGHSIMAAPEADADETRVVLDGGEERLVIMANEMHAVAGNDFAKNVNRVIAEWQAEDKNQSYTVAPDVISHDSLKLIVVTLKNAIAQSGEARLVQSCFVHGKDGTVQYIAAYANPDAAKDWTGISDLVRRIMETLSPGPSPSSLESRIVDIDRDLGLRISLPARIMYIDQPGPDFHVAHLYQCRELGEDGASIGIYIGSAPDFHPAKGSKQQSGVILGQPVTWFESTNSDQCRLETLAHSRQHPDVALHIFLSGSNERDVVALKQIVETLQSQAAEKQ